MTKRTNATTTGKHTITGGACACFNLRKATRMVTQLYDEALKPAGIRATQLTVLAATRSAGPMPPSRSIPPPSYSMPRLWLSETPHYP